MRALAAILAIGACATGSAPPPEPAPAEMRRPPPPCRDLPKPVASQAGLSAKDLERIRALVEETPERPITRIEPWRDDSATPRRDRHAGMALQVTKLTYQRCDGTSGEAEEFYLEKTGNTWKVIAREATMFIE